jgi:cell shape-determining protein MreD
MGEDPDMMSLVALWYIQDLFQALLSERFLVPDLFLVFLIYRMTKNPKEASSVIWPAFVGGLFWDLRWTALPGFTAAVYSLIAALCVVAWNRIPYPGRNAGLFSLMLFAAQASASLARFVFWGGFRGSLTEAFVFQLCAAVPVIIVAALTVAAGMRDENARR